MLRLKKAIVEFAFLGDVVDVFAPGKVATALYGDSMTLSTSLVLVEKSYTGPDLEGGGTGARAPRRSASGRFFVNLCIAFLPYFSMSRAQNERESYLLLNYDCQMSIISPLATVSAVIFICR